VQEDGNSRAKKGHKVLIRFYDGKKAVEGKIKCLGKIDVDGKTLIKLSFPKTLKLHQQRRHYRAKVIPEIDLRIINPMDARVIDMSPHGLAFCFPSDGTKITDGSKIDLKLKIPPTMEVQERLELVSGLVFDRSSSEFIEFNGHVRNTIPLPGENKICPAGSEQCGVQFDISSITRSLEIGEVYGFVEREYLRSIAKRKPKKLKKLNTAIEKKATGEDLNLWEKISSKWI
jgi:hypothetical protein